MALVGIVTIALSIFFDTLWLFVCGAAFVGT
jgi:hypothetical protein